MNAVVASGLRDPVHDAQRCFRAALQALARPARVQRIGTAIAGVPLGAAMAHLLLTLTDEETAVWWQDADDALAQWLRFHTGARATAHSEAAEFAVICDPASLHSFDRFAAGSPATPERSCTLLIEAPALAGGTAMRAHGPGVDGSEPVAIAGLHERFWSAWQANHAAFPQGVDAFFTAGESFLGLPRTTRIGRLEGL